MTTTEEITWIKNQIASFEAPIRQQTLLLKAYKAGGEATKEAFEKTTTLLGGLIAAKESLEEDLKTAESQS